MKRGLPEVLEQKQSTQRQDTANKVQQAIDELIAEKAIIKPSKLVERTGLSRSVFNKKHIKEVLEKNQVCGYKPKIEIDTTFSAEERVVTLEKELSLATSKLNEEKKRRLKIQEEKEELDKDYQLLLGTYHRAVRVARNYGVPIDEDK